MLKRIARTSFHRRKLVLTAWVLLIVALNLLNVTAGGTFKTDFGLPGSEGQEAIDILSGHGFGDFTGSAGIAPAHANGKD